MEIAIAGAGIAGLTSAIFLRRAGHRVVVYDKLPAPSPVGSGLIVQPTGQAVLTKLDLSEKLNARAARLDGLDGRLPDGKRKVLDVRYAHLSATACGRSVHRAALFEMLLAAAIEAGAEFEQGHEIVSCDPSRERPALTFANDTTSPQFDLIIDALGVRSPMVERKSAHLSYGALWANAPLPSAGFARHELIQRYRGAGCSSGVMPIGTLKEGAPELAAFFWTLRADAFEAWRHAPLDKWKDDVLSLWPEVTPVLDHFSTHDQFVFAHYAHHTLKQPVEGKVVHIGDAWHAASPQLGQGANMALLDAYALWLALSKNKSIEIALQEFVRMRQSHVRLYQSISHVFTPFYQSSSTLLSVLRDWFAGPVSCVPPMPKILAGLVSGTLGQPVKGDAQLLNF